MGFIAVDSASSAVIVVDGVLRGFVESKDFAYTIPGI